MMAKLQKSAFSCACRAETFEPDLLALDNKTFVRAFCQRQRYFCQAVCIAAACAGEVGVALAFCAIMGQFKMLRPLVDKDLVYESNIQQTFEGSVDCDLVEAFFSRFVGNLVLAEWLARLH